MDIERILDLEPSFIISVLILLLLTLNLLHLVRDVSVRNHDKVKRTHSDSYEFQDMLIVILHRKRHHSEELVHMAHHEVGGSKGANLSNLSHDQNRGGNS